MSKGLFEDAAGQAALSDYSHSSWVSRDGAPPGVATMAQTGDGFLWLGTPLGLYRFDGLRFSRFPLNSVDPELPSRNISALAADGAGGLWIASGHAGVSHLLKNRVRTFELPGALKGASIDGLFYSDDALWVLAGTSLLRMHEGTWDEFGVNHGLPRDSYFTLFIDREHNLWISSRHHVYVLRRGASTFSGGASEVFSVTQFAQTKEGTIWISDGWRGVRPLLGDPRSPPIPLRGTANMIIDPENHLWLGRDYKGVLRSEINSKDAVGTVSEFRLAQGLTSDVTRAMLRDRDGNIWLATDRGVDRFRRRLFTEFDAGPFTYFPALVASPDGGVWIAEHNRPLQKWSRGRLEQFGPNRGSSPLALDNAGGVWLRDPWDHKLHHYKQDGEELAAYETPKEIEDAAAQAIQVLPDQSLLINLERSGLWRFSGTWKKCDIPGLPTEVPSALAQLGDSSWIGYSGSRLFRLSSGVLTYFDQRNGLSVGDVLTVMSVRGQIWVGGAEGLAMLQDGTFHTLRFREQDIAHGVSGIAFDNQGDMWLNSASGVAHVRATELLHAQTDHSYELRAASFGEADGVVGSPAQVKPLPSAVSDLSGTIWFATTGSISYLTPGTRTEVSFPPPVALEGVSIDGQYQSLAQPVTVPGGGDHRLIFDFAAIDLSNPAQVSYRYKLDGEDTDWHQAGENRQALYARLRPGRYRFRVAATTGQDRWNEDSEPVLLVVRRAFYQTLWFGLLCVLSVFVLLWFCYLLRMQYVTARITDGMEQRSNERLRIARELHDTLLQSIHGLILRFHFATETMSAEDPSLPMLRTALERADKLIVEGRDRVQDLRGEASKGAPLTESLLQMITAAKTEGSPEVEFTERGTRKTVRPAVVEELCKIGREAITNALDHAAANLIKVDVVYGNSFLVLRIRDDGSGFSEEIDVREGRSGHWGLRGMRERARAIGAKLEVWTRPGSGTEIEVRLRASTAYNDGGKLSRLLYISLQQASAIFTSRSAR